MPGLSLAVRETTFPVIVLNKQHSAVYQLSRPCVLTNFSEFGKKAHTEASFVIPEIKKLITNARANNLSIIIISKGVDSDFENLKIPFCFLKKCIPVYEEIRNGEVAKWFATCDKFDLLIEGGRKKKREKNTWGPLRSRDPLLAGDFFAGGWFLLPRGEKKSLPAWGEGTR
ncbi:hypothetical protein B296_00047730 [Ensete ventricosum]|uniref:DUF7651 domain-containing protein n=1 Tax=Ensete ventricosum TaxID=4639 RepID=A0A426YY21_ENSVE|nr:hypothetical protein B296_00047730 [Ensete ventricosum]